jgi:hypothetical protein
MPVTDLCTLAQVKAWLPNAPASNDDVLLGALITSASGSILGYTQRAPVIAQSFTDVYDGHGESRKLLRRWPALSVQSVTVNGSVIQQSTGNIGGFSAGWTLDPWDGMLPGRPQILALRAYGFCRGSQNVVVAYTAGYQVTGEAQTVPAGGGAITTNQYNGPWVKDGGVVYQATGVALAPVTGVPATGQYELGTTPGQYVTAAGDAGKVLLITYSYVPSPLNQACQEMVAEAYRYRARIGERSHSVPGPATASFFDNSRLTRSQMMMVDPYRSVVPIV